MRVLVYEGLELGRHREAFDKVCAEIERGDFRSADVKKLHVGAYHRARLDHSNRLLLRFVRHGDETVCLALELIANHAYDRSRFLRGAKLDESRIVDAAEPAGVEAEPIRYLHPTRPTFHLLDKPLSFDDTQETVLRLPAPLVLVGSAGSGKTALTLQRLRQVPGTVAYVTHSPYLAETARALYFSHGFSREDQTAEFSSYAEMLASIRVPGGRAVTFRDFRAFFERHRANYRFTSAHPCFEEFRGVIGAQPSGPLGLDEYLALGVRQSIFGPAERTQLHTLFGKYREWLKASKLYDPNLVAHEWLALAEPRYDFMIVDEVQDVTPAELTLALRLLKDPGQFLLCGDANQIVHPNFFSWAQVKTLLHRSESLEDRTLRTLDVNYRNSTAVTEIANSLLKIKHARFGSIDKESNALVRPASTEPGSVIGLPANAKTVSEIDEKTRKSTRFAVLVLRDEDKEEARRKFRTPLVFSVHEAKGLEYDSVVLYEFVSRERTAFTELCEGVHREDLATDQLEYRRAKDKGDKSLEVHKFYVNALYVALTRAVRQVYLVESQAEHPLLKLLGVQFQGDTRSVQASASTLDEWQREANKLERQGKAEQAELIRSQVLKISKVPWTALDATGLRELEAKALPKTSPSNKARQLLLEFAAFHDLTALGERLASETGYAPAANWHLAKEGAVARALAPYAAKNIKDIFTLVERHGVDFRTPHGLTPLMMAARQGRVELVESLLDRGARRELIDLFGWTAFHWALERATVDAEYRNGPFAAVAELVAPPTLDFEVGGRLHKLGREQGEWFFFIAMVVQMKSLMQTRLGRFRGITAVDLSEGIELAKMPANVLPAFRTVRTYVNAILARGAVGTKYRPARDLWIRERTGHYLPNPAVSLRVVDERGEDRFVPIHEVLGLALHEAHWHPRAPGRLATAPPSEAPSAR